MYLLVLGGPMGEKIVSSNKHMTCRIIVFQKRPLRLAPGSRSVLLQLQPRSTRQSYFKQMAVGRQRQCGRPCQKFTGSRDDFQLVDYCFNLLLMMTLKMRRVIMLMMNSFFGGDPIHETMLWMISDCFLLLSAS